MAEKKKSFDSAPTDADVDDSGYRKPARLRSESSEHQKAVNDPSRAPSILGSLINPKQASLADALANRRQSNLGKSGPYSEIENAVEDRRAARRKALYDNPRSSKDAD